MPNLVKSINLTETDKAALEIIPHQSTVSKNIHQGQNISVKAECWLNEYIADKLDIFITAVRLCIDKYNAGDTTAALQGNKRRGRKAEITDADITWVINKAC